MKDEEDSGGGHSSPLSALMDAAYFGHVIRRCRSEETLHKKLHFRFMNSKESLETQPQPDYRVSLSVALIILHRDHTHTDTQTLRYSHTYTLRHRGLQRERGRERELASYLLLSNLLL